MPSTLDDKALRDLLGTELEREIGSDRYFLAESHCRGIIAFGRAVRDAALNLAAETCKRHGVLLDNERNRKLGVAKDLKDACQDCEDNIRALIPPGET